MASSVLAPVAFFMTVVIGPLQIVCVLGFFLLRHHAVFAIRVPKVVLSCMMLKLVSFILLSWLFLDPQCPCVIVPLMFWIDWTGNISNVLRKVVLLFRYEIQTALKHSKLESSITVLDKKNFFVRYRVILRTKTQTTLMFLIFLYAGFPFILTTMHFHDHALRPCATDVVVENSLLLVSIVLSFSVHFAPMILFSVWSTCKLRKFPHDNWQMGVESSYTSMMAVIAGLCCVIALVVDDQFDGLLLVLFSFSIVMQSLNFLMPLKLHRKTISQLARSDISKLTSLQRLLQEADFLEIFGGFLRKEFSGENLYFWQSVENFQAKYKATLLEETQIGSLSEQPNSAGGGDDKLKYVLLQAAEDCAHLGRQCVGPQAPWQIRISGLMGQDLEQSIFDLAALLETRKALIAAQVDDRKALQELRMRVIDALTMFELAQKEVFESWRQDAYPRFLLGTEARELNNNDHLKRVLAIEKLESEMHRIHTALTVHSSPSSIDETSSGKPTTNWSNCLSQESRGLTRKVDFENFTDAPEGNPPLKISSSLSLVVL